MALRSKLLLLAVGASSVVFTHGLASVAHAGPAPAVASASSRQHALAVALDGERREVTAQACREAERCVATGGRSYAIPAGADLANATLEVVSLAPDSRVVLVDVPLSGAEPAGSASKGRWVLLLAASAAKGAPHVEKLLVGTLDRPEGLEGEERSKVLLREREGGHERLLLGRRYAHAGLCGRPTTMRVSKLDPADRTWSEAPTVALSAAEREAAVPLIAERAEGGWPEGPSLLHARLASSALGGQRSALTDGDLATSWVETRPGVGEGEFVVMSGEASVPVSGFDLVLRAKGDAPPDRAAPRRVFVATRDQVFSIALGEDAGQEAPGQRYSVGLPKPVRSDCYALVLDEAFGDASHQAVAIAELRAQTPFDGMTLEALAAALDDEAKAEGAAALLNAGDAEAVTAVMNAYPQLSFDARRRALDLVGSGPCTATAPFYVERVLGRGAGDDFDPALDPIARAARDRLRRCRQPATAALGAAISEAGVTKERVWAARELAEIEPAQAVPAILAVLAEGSTAPSESGAKDEVRRGLRVALATAARDRHGAPAVQAALAAPAFAALSPVERVDLLRAVGPALPDLPGGEAAFSFALAEDDGFRTHYLLLPVAADLARAGRAAGTEALKRALAAEQAHLRAAAARAAGGVEALVPQLEAGLADASPRVREAALVGLGATAARVSKGGEAATVKLLSEDRWTFVREEAARALAGRPASPVADRALLTALSADVPKVRLAAVSALGKRKSPGAGEALVAVADGANEPVSLRVAAIRALGDLCYAESAEVLFKLAYRAAYQQLPYDQPLGLAALAALGELHPPGLAEALRPMLAKDRRVAPQVQAIARSVMAGRGRCNGSGAP